VRSAVAVTFAFTFTISGCSAVVAGHDHECQVDSDCAGRFDGGLAFCTSDNLCVAQVPEEQLCTELVPGGGDPNDPNTVMLGGFFRLSGMAGDKDTEMADAARMAMKEILETNQRQFGMVICDTAAGSDPSAPLRSLVKAVTTFHIVAAVGPTTSGNVVGIAPTVVTDNILIVSPSATSPAITGLADNSLVWRTCASDALQGGVLAGFIPGMIGTPLHTPTVNTAFVDSVYGQGLNSAFSAQWTLKTAQSPVSTTQFETPANADMVVSRLALDNPDYSLIVADDDASNLMHSLYTHDGSFKTTAQFLFTDGALGPNLIGTMPNNDICKRVFGTAPGFPTVVAGAMNTAGTNWASFRSRYKGLYNSDPADTSFVANTYDATYVIAMVVAGVPSGQPITGDKLAAEMMRLSGPGMKINVGQNDFPQGVNLLRQGATIDFVGASGELTWDDATGDVTDAPIEIWGIDTVTQPATPTICIVQPAAQKSCP
jgi:ABC-type branched-subunit amino acid transport system substrate-binding protein